MHRRAADDAWQTAIRTEPQMFFFSVIMGKVRHCAAIPQHFGPEKNVNSRDVACSHCRASAHHI